MPVFADLAGFELGPRAVTKKEAQMRSRVREFIQELEQLQGVDCVAVFGHEGTVHQMLSYALNYDVLLENVQVDNASASVFSYENGCWKLLKWNYTGQL